MKTAMQELIEWMEEGLGNGTKTIGNILEKSNELLEKEKEQIMNARDSTASELMKNMEDVWILGKSEYKTRTPEEYYNQTYKPETI